MDAVGRSSVPDDQVRAWLEAHTSEDELGAPIVVREGPTAEVRRTGGVARDVDLDILFRRVTVGGGVDLLDEDGDGRGLGEEAIGSWQEGQQQ